MKKNELLKHMKLIDGLPNFRLLPVISKPLNEPNVDWFNSIMGWIHKNKLPKIVRTPSGGISTFRLKKYLSQYDWVATSWLFEITLLLNIKGNMYGVRFQLGRANTEDGSTKFTTGRQVLKKFRQDCAKMGIKLNKMALPIGEGKKVKETIEKPYIDIAEGIENKIFSNVHHIDFHSSHVAGMVKYYPELKPVFDKYYELRHKEEAYKRQLVLTWGSLQSPLLCGAKWAHIARDGIHDTNERLQEITNRLVASGRRILAHNTDGVWYQGEIYHGDGEGTKMGEWQNDHTNCTIRFKSVGAYEYYEGDKYTPVVRGLIGYDKTQPDRSKWHWGDIYNGETLMFYADYENELIIKKEVY